MTMLARLARTSRSMSPARTRALANARSFSRPATSLEIAQSCGSRGLRAAGSSSVVGEIGEGQLAFGPEGMRVFAGGCLAVLEKHRRGAVDGGIWQEMASHRQ